MAFLEAQLEEEIVHRKQLQCNRPTKSVWRP